MSTKHEEEDDGRKRGVPVPKTGTPIRPVEVPQLSAEVQKALEQIKTIVDDLDAGRLHPDDVTGKLRETIRALPVDVTGFTGMWKTLRGLGAAEWLKMEPPRRRWLLELQHEGDTRNHEGEKSTGVVPLGKVGMLAAAGAAGKTMALVQLALAVATGREWLDTYSTPNPGRVLLALGEEDAEEVRRRLYSAGKQMRLTDEQWEHAIDHIVVLPLAGKRIALTDERGEATEVLGWLKSQLRDDGEWRLIVLDPLSRYAAGGDTEKDNAAATTFIEQVETLTEMPGRPAVVLAHHVTKNARKDDPDVDAAVNAARGSGALTDNTRWVANLEPVKGKDEQGRTRTVHDLVRLTWVKSNYSIRAPGVVLVRVSGGALRAETKTEREQREQREAEPEQEHDKAKGNGTRKASATSD